MSQLKVVHDKIDDIPEAYRELYTEKDGVFALTGVQGVKTQGDIDRLDNALRKERGDHKETKTKLQVWGELKYDEVQGKLDRFGELEIAASGNKEEMDSKLNEMTEARVASRLAPVERENGQLKTRLTEIEQKNKELMADKAVKCIRDAVCVAAMESKVITEALPDVLLLANAVFEVADDEIILTRENRYGITPGLSAEVFLQEMQDKRPHWWPNSIGGGARGSRDGKGFANNPWSKEHWNMTEQGKIVTEHGDERADQMAKSAGTTVGGPIPAEAPQK